MHSHAVLIINWNSKDLLAQCLDALRLQTDTSFATYVADNNSLESLPQSFQSEYPQVIFIQNDHNYGFAEGNNRLLRLVGDSEWVILLNPDTEPRADWFETLVGYSTRYPNFACYSSRLLMRNAPDILDGDGDNYHISGLASRHLHGTLLKKCLPSNRPREIFSACAAAAMYKTHIIKKLGGFDEAFFCYLEDVDLGFRLRLAGYRTIHIPAAVVLHHGSATSGGKKSDFALYHGHRNIVWTFVKNMPGLLFWLFLPLHVLMNFLAIIYFSCRGQAKSIFKAKYDAIRGVPKMWRKRKLIQKHRVASVSEVVKMIDKQLIPPQLRKT